MNKPELLRQIATAMEQDPDGWWYGFEYWGMMSKKWLRCSCEADATRHLHHTELRPRPRTIRIDVEVPEPMREMPEVGEVYWFIIPNRADGIISYTWYSDEIDKLAFKHAIWPTEAEAQQAADAIFGALGRQS